MRLWLMELNGHSTLHARTARMFGVYLTGRGYCRDEGAEAACTAPDRWGEGAGICMYVCMYVVNAGDQERERERERMVAGVREILTFVHFI